MISTGRTGDFQFTGFALSAHRNIHLTSNLGPDKWSEFFSEDSSLLCSLDRIFDFATVFTIKGQSYRGRNRTTVSLSVGQPNALPRKEYI